MHVLKVEETGFSGVWSQRGAGVGRRDEAGDWGYRMTPRSDLCFGQMPLAGEEGAWTKVGTLEKA